MRSAAAVAATGGVLFGLLLAPGLTWLDAGELGAAAWELGVAHPPGFPLFAQLHGLVMHVVPLGDAALRGNLASALLGAVALGFMAAAARQLGAGTLAAAAGALLVGLTQLFVLHATTIEVYSGAACWLAAALWLGLRWRAEGDPRDGLALGLLIGLAAGHHAELRLFVVLLLPALVLRLRGHGRFAAFAFGFAVLGGLVVLYLPLRSAADPMRDWGNPETLGALWDHLMGARIRAAYRAEFGRLRLADLSTFIGQLWVAGPLLLALGLSGLLAAARRPGGFWLGLIWLVDLAYATALNPMGLRDLQNGVPGLVALGVGAAMSLDLLARRAPGPRWGVPALALAGALAFPFVGRLVPPSLDRGQPELIAAAAAEPPPEALALVSSDDFAAGFAWAQVVEGARPDLAVVVRQHAWDASSMEPTQRRVPAALAGWSPAGGLASLQRLSGGWPVRWEWTSGSDAAVRPGDLGPVFPWFGRPSGGDFIGAARRLLGRAPGAATRRAVARLVDAYGRWHLGARPERARQAMGLALELDPENPVRWVNVGQALFATGRLDHAIKATEAAVHLDPESALARINLARLLLQARDADNALQHLEVVLDDEPTHADARAIRGVIRANRGDLQGAASDWRAALGQDPEQLEARAGLERLSRRRPSERKRAKP